MHRRSWQSITNAPVLLGVAAKLILIVLSLLQNVAPQYVPTAEELQLLERGGIEIHDWESVSAVRKYAIPAEQRTNECCSTESIQVLDDNGNLLAFSVFPLLCNQSMERVLKYARTADLWETEEAYASRQRQLHLGEQWTGVHNESLYWGNFPGYVKFLPVRYQTLFRRCLSLVWQPHFPPAEPEVLSAELDKGIPRPTTNVRPYKSILVPPHEGMGATPLNYVHLLHLLDAKTCQSFVSEIEAYAEANDGWTTGRHKDYPTTDIQINETPLAKDIYPLVQKQVFPLMSELYGVPEVNMKVADLFFVKYAEDGQRDLEMHRDDSTLSFSILCSHVFDFHGGGTLFSQLGGHVSHDRIGDLLIHSGNLLHGGRAITKGSRYLIVGFIQVEGYQNQNRWDRLSREQLPPWVHGEEALTPWPAHTDDGSQCRLSSPSWRRLRQVRRFFPYIALDGFLALLGAKASSLTKMQQQPHADLYSPTAMASVFTLTTDPHYERTGTALVRTRVGRISRIRNDSDYSKSQAEFRGEKAFTGFYSGQSNRVIETVAIMRNRFNRLNVYPSNRLHTGVAPSSRYLKRSLSDGRLTVSMFWELDTVVQKDSTFCQAMVWQLMADRGVVGHYPRNYDDKLHACQLCSSLAACRWVAGMNECLHIYQAIPHAMRTSGAPGESGGYCPDLVSPKLSPCTNKRSCDACAATEGCEWCIHRGHCREHSDRVCDIDEGVSDNSLCSAGMHEHDCTAHRSCETCMVSANCVWCSGEASPCRQNVAGACGKLKTSHIVRPGGSRKCNAKLPKPVATCGGAKSCYQCSRRKGCGWCFDGMRCLPLTEAQRCQYHAQYSYECSG